MANILELNAQPRKRNGTAEVNRLRKEGLIPAVLYGRGMENQNLKVDGTTFSKMMEGSASDNVLVNLNIEGGPSKQLALVQEVQHDYLKDGLLHVDFHAVAMDEEIHAQVPIEMEGDAEGVQQGGLLELMLHTVEVRCLPKDLPSALVANVTDVGLGQAVHVGDLKLPEGVTPALDKDVVVILCVEPKVGSDTPAAEEEATTEAAPAETEAAAS